MQPAPLESRRRIVLAVLAAIGLLVLFGSASAAPGEVEEIFVQGLSRMTKQAFLHAFGVDVGDPFDARRIQGRFRSVWDLKLFEDIAIETEIGPEGGHVLVIKVRERPVVTSITYDDNGTVTRTQIEDRYKEKDIPLRVGKPLDMGSVYFAESSIRDLFGEKGYLDAQVSAEVREVTATTRAVHFTMIQGGKTRIRKIEFTGNELYSQRKLKGTLQLTQERKWYWPWSAKNLYHPIKWDQDVSSIRDLYQNTGYLDVEVRAPIVEVKKSKKDKDKDKGKGKSKGKGQPESESQPSEDGEVQTAEVELPPPDLTPKKAQKLAKSEAKARKKAIKAAKGKQPKRWVFLTVPIVEGQQYTLGQVTVEGNEVFSDPVLRAMIPLAESGVLSNGALELGVDRITRLYEDAGFLYSSVVRNVNRRESEQIADVEIQVDEDKPYYVGRLNFLGNTETHDRVLRREMLISEGDLFSRTRLDLSRAKVNQLGYFQVPGEPLVEPVEDEQRVTVSFPGQEQGRNEIQIGGGFSGVEGAFFNGVYSTRNFLGRGQTLSLALQIGGRSSRYQISFQEPWFLNKPYLLGVNLFRRDSDFGQTLNSTSQGLGFVLGKRLRRFSRINLAYSLENVTSDSVAGVGAEAVIIETKNTISSVTPVYTFSTINNPYRPNRGTSFSASVRLAGGPLGGDTNFVKPLLNFTAYRKAWGRMYLALHAEFGLVRAFGDQPLVSSQAGIEGVPRFERFWLGGDTLGPRVFETRTITPRRFVRIENGQIVEVIGNPVGRPAGSIVNAGGVPVLVEVGGDRMYKFQSELIFPINEQADIALFFDMGDALFEDTRIGFDTVRASAGLELRFHLPIFPVPLRLIYGWPIRELVGDRSSNFTFSIGRSF